MSVEEVPETLQRQYQARFAGSEDFRNGVWKVLCERFFMFDISPGATGR